MSLILFNKPFGVMCQFSPHPTRSTLSDHIALPGVYPAGRLDADSEGLVLLTDDGQLQRAISHPAHKQPKTYLAQVEGIPDAASLARLRMPLQLGEFRTRACMASQILEPAWLWSRRPPIRERRNQPVSWLAITITEGKNRQVRHMTAAVGLPTLRLIRSAIGPYTLARFPLMPGAWCAVPPALLQAAS
jgi:23S rRNA pseudouridine2457 synthase